VKESKGEIEMTKRGIRRMVCVVGAATLSLSFAGCGQLKQPEPTDKTQLKLTMDIRGATNVAGMRFVIQKVDCRSGAPTSAPPQTIDKDLEDLTIPDQVPAVANMPLDAGSSHVFADAFVTLAPGCYDVTTTPIDAGGKACTKCAPAHLSKVQIKPEQTTEVFLINQCEGTPTGAIDISSALNHPPQIQSLMFPESKYVASCVPETVCATALDPDSDPLEWSWSVIDGPAHAGPVVVSTTMNRDGSVTQCVQVEGQEAGKLDVTLTVYDLVSPNGTPERVEQWLADQGYPNPSHAALTFPVYIGTGRTPSPEVCDGIDNDCNLQTDEGLTHDADGDGFTSTDSCFGSKDDCDDNNAAIHPGAEEVCDKVDNNCNGQVDEGGVCKGPDPQCSGQTCFNFTGCNQGGSCSSSGVCGSTAEGGGLCVDGNTACEGLRACNNGSSDCDPGDICIVNSCCTRPVCVPQARFCSMSPAPRAAAEPMSVPPGPTLAAP
jgi:hypothetical protein